MPRIEVVAPAAWPHGLQQIVSLPPPRAKEAPLSGFFFFARQRPAIGVLPCCDAATARLEQPVGKHPDNLKYFGVRNTKAKRAPAYFLHESRTVCYDGLGWLKTWKKDGSHTVESPRTVFSCQRPTGNTVFFNTDGQLLAEKSPQAEDEESGHDRTSPDKNSFNRVP